ncbi:transposase [Streptomyces griseorubiginosus]|uniref:transposase n=1 Tax=Streptomyces griseorubiginosus TaxID=67304 RepID=UPI00366058B4
MSFRSRANRRIRHIIAETGGDMARCASARHLAHWAGVCPGHHESAGRTKNTKVRPGNPYLKAALGLAAFGAVRTKDTFLQARHKRLTAHRGPMKAWSPTCFAQRHPERSPRRAITALNQLGYTVTWTRSRTQPDTRDPGTRRPPWPPGTQTRT